MSGHPVIDEGSNDDRSQKVSEEYINFIIFNAVPKITTLQQIKEATASYVILQKIFKCIKSNNWKEARESKGLCQFYHIRDELCSSVNEKILGPTDAEMYTHCDAANSTGDILDGA